MADRSRLFIAIGLLVVAVGVALYFLVIRPRGAAPETPTVAQAPAGPAEPAPGTPAPSPAPAARTGDDDDDDDDDDDEAAPAEEPKPAPELRGSLEPFRADPFARFALPKDYVLPQPPLVLAFIPYPPVDMARIQVRLTPIDEVPPRRVCGLLWDGRVWALVVIRGRTSVVKPGDIVEDGMVQAITDEGLLLKVPDQEELVLVPLERGVARPSTLGPTPGGLTRPGVRPRPMPAGARPSPAYPMGPGASRMVPVL